MTNTYVKHAGGLPPPNDDVQMEVGRQSYRG